MESLQKVIKEELKKEEVQEKRSVTFKVDKVGKKTDLSDYEKENGTSLTDLIK